MPNQPPALDAVTSAPYTGPLCGDSDCGCPTQADLDAYHQRQWDDAGELVYGLLGLTYKGGS